MLYKHFGIRVIPSFIISSPTGSIAYVIERNSFPAARCMVSLRENRPIKRIESFQYEHSPTFAAGLFPYPCQLILIFLLAAKNTSTVALRFEFP